jgi:hypothetical protein
MLGWGAVIGWATVSMSGRACLANRAPHNGPFRDLNTIRHH